MRRGQPCWRAGNCHWHDDKNSPRVAIVNREFAGKILGSVTNAVGRYYKLRDGSRVQVVGIVEDGKYASLAEDPQPAMFLPILQQPPSNEMALVVRSNRDPQQLSEAITSTVRKLDAGLPFTLHTWNQELESALFPSRMATMALGVLGMMGAVLSITGIFGMAAYSVSKRLQGVGNSYRPRRAAQRSVAGGAGTGIQIAGYWFGGRTVPRNSGEPGAGFHRVSGNSPRSAGIGRGCSSYGVAGAAGDLDSGTTRTVG